MLDNGDTNFYECSNNKDNLESCMYPIISNENMYRVKGLYKNDARTQDRVNQRVVQFTSDHSGPPSLISLCNTARSNFQDNVDTFQKCDIWAKKNNNQHLKECIDAILESNPNDNKTMLGNIGQEKLIPKIHNLQDIFTPEDNLHSDTDIVNNFFSGYNTASEEVREKCKIKKKVIQK